MQKNVLQILEKTAFENPEKIAFSDINGSLLYKDFVDLAQRIGSCLAGMNRFGKPIAVMFEKSKEAVACYMGVVYSGNFYVPIDSKMPEERIKKIMETLCPCAFIADRVNLEKAKKMSIFCDVICYDDMVKCDIDVDKLQEIRGKVIDTDPVYALFTSGSTGVAKGVVCCHRSVIDYSDWLIDTFAFNTDTILGNQTQFYFSMSVLDIYATIRSGAELHIIPNNLFSFPIKLLEYMNERKINAIYWVPTALCLVANLKALTKVKMPYLQKILFAGESMPTKQLNIWRKYVPNACYANLFGPTEITDIGIYYIVDRDFMDTESLPIGKCCDNVDILILNESGKEVEKGEIGELYVRGSFLALGYYNNLEKTKEVFVQNPLNNSYPEIVYKTGDLVSVNQYDELMYHGRKDYQIKYKGNRIELGEIETATQGIDGVERCACIYEEKKQKIILCYKGAAQKDNLLQELRNKVPEYMVPNVLLQLEDFPYNANGKIDRIQLKLAYKIN